MRPTSQGQADAAARRGVPAVEEVRPGLWALPSPMDGAAHLPFAFIWALRDPADARGAIDLIDAGLDRPANRELFVEQLAALGATPAAVRRVVITHLHPDHTGLAEWLRSTAAAEVVMSTAEAEAQDRFHDSHRTGRRESLDRWAVPAAHRRDLEDIGGAPLPAPLSVDRLVDDGHRIELGGSTLRVVATPGHTGGHIALADDEHHQIYTGDHVLPTMHPGIGLGGSTGTNPLTDFVASCEAMAPYADHEGLPGHGYRFRGVAERARLSMGHHLRRAEQVRAVLEQQPDATVWQVAERLPWSAGWGQLAPGYRFSALLQTEIFRDYVRSTGPARS